MTEKLHFFLERVGGTIFYLVLYSCIYQAETAGQFLLLLWLLILERDVTGYGVCF